MKYKDEANLEERLIAALKSRSLTVSTAESCTGGMISERLTACPGASDCFMGTVVSYSNNIKNKLLSVKKETLEIFGAVSEETAREMAKGVVALLETDIAVSVTGIAGPGGGTPKTPVGCVCFGLSAKDIIITKTMYFGENNTRDEIRRLAADYAMALVLSYINGDLNA